MPTSRSKSNSNPLTSPAVPVALQPHHLLSPPADLLTNTATTLTITPTPDTKPPSPAFIVHRIRAHEAPDSPDRAVLLYSVYSKPWPNTSRVVCDTEEVPLLVLRRVWLSRKWAVRLPDQHQDLLVATVPWTADGQSRVGVGVGGGFRLEARFANALASRPGSGIIRGRAVGAEESGYVADEPPPYSAIAGVGVEGGGGSGQCEGNAGVVQRNEKIHPPLPNSHSHFRNPLASTPRHSQQPRSPSILPSYDSVRRDAPNPLRDLLDALEPPHEPAPAALYPVSASASRNLNAGIGTSTSLGPIHAEADAIPGAKVELRVMQVATSGTGVMMGNQKIMNITRHNAMDFSKSKVRLRPRWEVEVSEGVDLLLAVNLVLIMAESVSSQNRWK
ncbi:hypothetical protein PDIG_86260 [Penicillium digitatum PHI26]|uniref:Uncharacterized protein n=2 Tax=Penicillium digitatum TaxID=36651 RepID=K9F672_PEND2|nr:hypothetical protein PDIP_32280 [Penicillium digitatum Pd1]EKV04825.1 hypothetical protein PDIG_86260 [Penicillium digitatum PHI26]EKV17212.1 hypothetical protein PDIP_32280 [Penicillium digitatum Pd1]